MLGLMSKLKVTKREAAGFLLGVLFLAVVLLFSGCSSEEEGNAVQVDLEEILNETQGNVTGNESLVNITKTNESEVFVDSNGSVLMQCDFVNGSEANQNCSIS